MLDTKIGQTPPPIIIDHLSMVYSGQESEIEINPEYFDKAQNLFEEMQTRHEQFEEIIKKIDKGLDYDLRELTSVDFIHIMQWPRPVMLALHEVICDNSKGIIGDEYAINFFLGMDPAYFAGIEQFEVKELGR